jgi:peptidoglycan hydrolase CwlO-like protein
VSAPWLRGFLALFQPRPTHFQRIIMTQLSDLKDAVASLTAETETLNGQNTVLLAKVDALVTLTDNIKERLVQLAESGQLPPNELSSLTSAINASRDAIHAIGTADSAEATKVDDAVTRDTVSDDDGATDTTDTTDTTGADSTAADGTPPADTSAPTDGSGEAPTDTTTAENPTETP